MNTRSVLSPSKHIEFHSPFQNWIMDFTIMDLVLTFSGSSLILWNLVLSMVAICIVYCHKILCLCKQLQEESVNDIPHLVTSYQNKKGKESNELFWSQDQRNDFGRQDTLFNLK